MAASVVARPDPEPTSIPWAATPGRELATRAWPIAVSTLSYSAMTLVGVAFVARVGAAEVAGVGLAGVAAFTLLCFAIGALRGAKTLIAQALGAGRREDADRYLGVAILFALGWGVLTLVLAEAAAPLLRLLAKDPEQGMHAATYLRLRALAAPMVLCSVAMRETRWAEGDARATMRATVAGNLANGLLDFVLIVVLDQGVVGAGLASIVGCAVELALLAWPMRPRLRKVAWRPAYARALWKQGAPTGVQFLLEVGAFMVVSAVVAQMGSVDGAAHQLVLQLSHVSFLPAHALAEAASVLVGQAVGAGRLDLVRPVARHALVLGTLYAGLCTIVFVVAGGPIARALGASEGEVLVTTRQLIHVAALFLVADAANVIARGVLRGVGDAVYPAVVGVITAWVVTPPLAALFGLGLGWGAVGGWLGLTLEIFVGAAILWRRLARDDWRGPALATRQRTLTVDAQERGSANILLPAEPPAA